MVVRILEIISLLITMKTQMQRTTLKGFPAEIITVAIHADILRIFKMLENLETAL